MCFSKYESYCIATAFRNNDTAYIDNYKVSEYSNLIDTGDSNASVLENIGFGNDYSLSEADNTRAFAPGSLINRYKDALTGREWKIYFDTVNQFDWDESTKNSKFDFVIIIGNKIIKSHYNKTKPNVYAVEYLTEDYAISSIMDGDFIYDEATRRILETIAESTEPNHKGTVDTDLYNVIEQRTIGESVGADTAKNGQTSRDNGGINAIYQPSKAFRYALDTYDNDSESLTPKRKAEIHKQWLNVLSQHKKRYQQINTFTDEYRICGGERSLRDTSIENANKKFALLAGVNEYTYDFAELVNDYWTGDKQFIDNYKVSEYSNLIDTGDSNASVLENIGFGNDYSLSVSFDDIPPHEYLQLRDYIMNKNNSAGVLSPTDCKEIGDNFYVWNNISKTDFTVTESIPIVGNEDIIDGIRSDIQNGTIRNTQRISEWVAGIRSGKRVRTVLGGGSKGATSNGSNDRFSVRQPESDARRYTGGDGSDSQRSQVIRYALDTYDNDSESLTQKRKAEIHKQWAENNVDIEKPTIRQLFGDMTSYVAHNASRVFPNIPERGEKGTFFAEFRKNMIQWTKLADTASFVVRDKLNKMTEGLTPEEFKTFSELVYFLDLQEEAQIQKDKGYTEILLPNEITPAKVDEIVK